MRTPSLPKGWKVEGRNSYVKLWNGSTGQNYENVHVITNPAGKVVMVLVPKWDHIYEYSEIETMTEAEFLEKHTWEPKGA